MSTQDVPTNTNPEGSSGLTNTQRSIMEIVILTLVGLPGVILTLGEDVPRWVGPVLLIASFVAGVAKNQLGIKEAGVAVKAKAIDTAAKVSMKFGDVGKGDVVPAEKAVK